MLCQDFLPSPALRPYIRGYHLRHFLFAAGQRLPFKPYAPRPEQTLAFFPRALERVEYVASNTFLTRPRSMLMGQAIERTNRHVGGPDFLVFIVDFQPGVLHRLTGMPLPVLTNTQVDAEAVFPKLLPQVNQRLNSTDCYPEMIAIVEAFLLQLVGSLKREAHPLDALTCRLIEHPEEVRLLQLAEQACLCRRQFERKFKERMGVSPRMFARIARLHRAFRLRYRSPQLDWLSIALACGYYDYQHLVKDFQNLTGVSPTTYLREDTQAPERAFGLLDSSL